MDKILLEERKKHLNYVEKSTKGKLDKVIVELSGNESGAISRLSSRYVRLETAIKVMGEKRQELNDKIKKDVEDIFELEDAVLTRVIETVSFTLTVSKQEKSKDKVTVDYETIATELSKLIAVELQPKVDEIYKAYTKIVAQADKSPALRVKSKIDESFENLSSSVSIFITKLITGFRSWIQNFDSKFNKIKSMYIIKNKSSSIKLESLQKYLNETETSTSVYLLFMSEDVESIIPYDVIDMISVFSSEEKVVTYITSLIPEMNCNCKSLQDLSDFIDENELYHYNKIFNVKQVAIDTGYYPNE